MKYCWIIFPLFLLFACDTEDEQLPAYIYVDNVVVNTTLEEGTNDARVPNGFLDANQDELGVVTVPGRVPVLESGGVNIRFDPAIRANGSSATLSIYPFYERYETTLQLTELETDTLRPVVGYRDDAIFAFVENFDDPNTVFTDDRDGDPETRIDISANGAFENGSAVVQLSGDHRTIELATDLNDPFDLPDNVRDAFLEVNFRGDVPILFGIIGQNAGQNPIPSYEWVLNPKEEWTKIYLELTEAIQFSGFDTYRISFIASLEGSELSEGEVWLDNVKFIYR